MRHEPFIVVNGVCPWSDWLIGQLVSLRHYDVDDVSLKIGRESARWAKRERRKMHIER